MRDKGNFIVCKVLNNNVILACKQGKTQEMILVGNGIGFGRKAEDIIQLADHEIEKAFVTYEENIIKSG